MPDTMRSTILASVVVVGVIAPAVASAGKFGGFSADGTKYLDGDAKVCTPLSATPEGSAVGAPQCTVVSNKKDLAAYNFRKARPSDTMDGIRLSVSASGKTLRVEGTTSDGGKLKVVTWDAPTDIAATGDIYVTDGKVVAVEYTATTLRGATPSVIAFNATGSMAKLTPAPAEKPKDPPAPAKPTKGSSYDRAMAKGGVWEQPLVQCDQARITLTLKKNMKYSVRVETRCQGDKSVSTFSGRWVAEGTHGVVLQLDNDDGGTESIGCQLGESDDEPTIKCSDEDVEFTMKPVKR